VGQRTAASIDKLRTLSLSKCRVNPEPRGFTRGLEFVERQAQAVWPGSQRVDKQFRFVLIDSELKTKGRENKIDVYSF
jgi:hypothetical protein